MKCARCLVVAFVALLGVIGAARPAAANVALCLAVSAPAAEREGFDKLVRAEIARHKSHQVVETGCRSRLRVELFDAAASRYLTAQIDGEVPARYAIRDGPELAARLEDAIRLVLRNDPVSLADDPARMDAFQRFGQAVVVRGRTTFRFELFDLVSRDARGPTTLPGFGAALWRGSGHWQMGLRLYGAGSLQAASAVKPALEVAAGVDGCLGYEPFLKEFWTPYAAACAGVRFVELAGRIHGDAPTAAHAYDAGFVPSLRLGVRLFRWHAFDVDVFAQGYLPISSTEDVDGVLLPSKGIYMPALMAGFGLGF